MGGRIAAVQKQFGVFYTPQEIASALVRWAIRSPQDVVLDPGAGEAVFLQEAYRRIVELGAESKDALDQLYGIELNLEAYARSSSLLEEQTGLKPKHLFNLNFFEVGTLRPTPLPCVDIIIGNPPYIRYHFFTGPTRALALKVASRAGVYLSQLTSSWAPYLIHAVSFLKKDGRLAMVVPAELLHVDYADPVREFLLRAFREVTIITFEKRVFPGVLEEVVLLLADRQGAQPGLRVIRLNNLEDLQRLPLILSTSPMVQIQVPAEKWAKYLLTSEQYRVYEDLIQRGEVFDLGEEAKVDIGVVTGANEFFFLSNEEIIQWGIERRFCRKAIRKAADIPGALFTGQDWKNLRVQGAKCHLLNIHLPVERLKQFKVWKYLKHGEELGFPHTFKCRTREPWYTVPYVRIPDAFITYMSNEMPRFVLNEAKAINPNTIHSISFKFIDSRKRRAFVSSFYNTLTMLSAELAGRSYGGGVLKLETKEAEQLKLVRLEDRSLLRALNPIVQHVDQLLRAKQTKAVLDLIDQILLKEYLKLSDSMISQLRMAYESIRARRLARSG